jgi:hypothetical protein
MPARFLRKVATAILLSALTGCSTIGTVNGARLNDGPVTERPPFCGDYEWLCIGLGLAVLGGTIAALQENGHHGGQPTVSQSPQNP